MGKAVDGRAEFDEREAEGAAGDDEREYRPRAAAVVAQEPGLVPAPARVVVPAQVPEHGGEVVVPVVQAAAVAQLLEEPGRRVAVASPSTILTAHDVVSTPVTSEATIHITAEAAIISNVALVPPVIVISDDENEPDWDVLMAEEE